MSNITARIKYNLAKAERSKLDIKHELDEVIKYTSRYGYIKDELSKGLIINTVDPVVLDAKDHLENFIMNLLFGVREKWVKLGISKPAFYANSNLQNEQAKEQALNEYNEKLESVTDDVFSYLFESNYYMVISKAVSDCATLGTGCYKVIELKGDVKPFTYEYVDINGLFIEEDMFGVPNYVFKKHFEMTKDEIEAKFPNAKFPPGEDESKYEGVKEAVLYDTIESVIPEFNYDTGVTTYHYSLHDSGFEHEFFSDELEYNPYRVFRFKNINDNPWGQGVGTKALASIKNLRYYKKLRATQALKIVNPATGYIGDKALAYQLSQEPGAENYLGDGINGQIDVKNIGVVGGGNLIPVDQDIANLKNEIRDLYMAKPFGDINEQEGAKSTVEIQRRYELFTQRYSGTASIFYNELLSPTFYAPFKILLKRKLISIDDEILKSLSLTFENELTKGAEQQKVQRVAQAQAFLMNTFPRVAEYTIKGAEVSVDSVRKMGVPDKFINSVEEINNSLEQTEAQEQALAMQQLATAKGQGMETGGIEDAISG